MFTAIRFTAIKSLARVAAVLVTLCAALQFAAQAEAQTTPSQLEQLTTWYTKMDGSDGTVELLSDQISYLLAGHASYGGSGLLKRFIEQDHATGPGTREINVPVIGFAAWSRKMAANPGTPYGRIVEHSYRAAAATPSTTPPP